MANSVDPDQTAPIGVPPCTEMYVYYDETYFVFIKHRFYPPHSTSPHPRHVLGITSNYNSNEMFAKSSLKEHAIIKAH